LSTPSSVADLGEHALIELVRARVGPAPAWLTVGIGDDAAVIEPARNQLDVVTTDVQVEGVHFDRAFTPPDAIGHRALAVNLSDLAAMGALPRSALLSLALPRALPISDLTALIDGLLALAARYGVSLVGGNISRSPGPLFVDITAMGSCRRRRVLQRSTARPGDDLWVSGTIGAASAGLACLQRHGAGGPEWMEPSVQRFLRPEPRVRLGRALAGNRAASSCIDLSDGLADGVRQLAAASGLGAIVEAGALPIEPSARRWFEEDLRDAVDATLASGDDYELLFTAPRRYRVRVESVAKREGPLTRIGTMTAEGRLLVSQGGESRALPDGYQHFR
jgi:thiamine-monophosphate kinase